MVIFHGYVSHNQMVNFALTRHFKERPPMSRCDDCLPQDPRLWFQCTDSYSRQGGFQAKVPSDYMRSGLTMSHIDFIWFIVLHHTTPAFFLILGTPTIGESISFRRCFGVCWTCPPAGWDRGWFRVPKGCGQKGQGSWVEATYWRKPLGCIMWKPLGSPTVSLSFFPVIEPGKND